MNQKKQALRPLIFEVMKRLYSVILLISLLVGTLQPILPMIEYQLDGGDIIELLGFGDDNTEMGCRMATCLMEDCGTQEAETDRSLLDLDYYPLALEITTVPNLYVFRSSIRVYLPSPKHVISLAFLPIPPPPRLS